MNNIELTVIITVFNCEKTIRKCLNSLLNQYYIDNYEIIIIDDGSTDLTVNIIKGYLSLFKNITLLEQKNQGSYVARNLGLENANGTFITFLDGDDYIDKDMYAILLQENSFDMTITDFIKEDSCGNSLSQEEDIFDSNRELTMNERNEVMKKILNSKMMASLWRCVYSKSFLEKNSIKFYDNVYRGADLIFNLKCLFNAQNIKYIQSRKYHYVYYQTSISNNITINNWIDFCKIDNEIRNICINEYEDLINERYMGNAIWMMSSICKNKDYKHVKIIMEDIQFKGIHFNLKSTFYDKIISLLINTKNTTLLISFIYLYQLLIRIKGVIK